MIIKILDNLSSDEDTKNAQIDIINNTLNPPRKKEDKESRPKITADNLTTANLKEFVIINQTLQESIEYESATNKLKGQISVANSVNESVHESNETFIEEMKSGAKGTMTYKRADAKSMKSAVTKLNTKSANEMATLKDKDVHLLNL